MYSKCLHDLRKRGKVAREEQKQNMNKRLLLASVIERIRKGETLSTADRMKMQLIDPAGTVTGIDCRKKGKD